MSGFRVPFPSDENNKKESNSGTGSTPSPSETSPVTQIYDTPYSSNSNTLNKRKLKVSNENNHHDSEHHDVALTEDSPTTGSTVFPSESPLDGIPVSQIPIQYQKSRSSKKSLLTPTTSVPFVITDDEDESLSIPLTAQPVKSKGASKPKVTPDEGLTLPNTPSTVSTMETTNSQPVYNGITAREILSLEDIESLDAVLDKLAKLVKIAEAKKTVVRAHNEVSKGLLD